MYYKISPKDVLSFDKWSLYQNILYKFRLNICLFFCLPVCLFFSYVQFVLVIINFERQNADRNFIRSDPDPVLLKGRILIRFPFEDRIRTQSIRVQHSDLVVVLSFIRLDSEIGAHVWSVFGIVIWLRQFFEIESSHK